MMECSGLGLIDMRSVRPRPNLDSYIVLYAPRGLKAQLKDSGKKQDAR